MEKEIPMTSTKALKLIGFTAWLAASSVFVSATLAKADEPDWSGFYVGAHAGYGWGDADHRETNGGMTGSDSYAADGGLIGGTAGYNWQRGIVVVGIEGDLGYMDLTGSGRIASSVPTKYQALDLDGGLYGTVTARLGFALGNTLVYGKGGWAFYRGDATQTTTNPGFVTHGTDTFSGWTLGGGVERMITDKLSIKVEYQHLEFGTEAGDQTSVSDDPIRYVYRNETDLTADTVKFGLNYHF
jgi:outer membrane immunogenic protein